MKLNGSAKHPFAGRNIQQPCAEVGLISKVRQDTKLKRDKLRKAFLYIPVLASTRFCFQWHAATRLCFQWHADVVATSKSSWKGIIKRWRLEILSCFVPALRLMYLVLQNHNHPPLHYLCVVIYECFLTTYISYVTIYRQSPIFSLVTKNTFYTGVIC